MGRKSETTKRSWKQWKPAQARRELKAWRASGLPLGAYARLRGFTTTRLSCLKMEWAAQRPSQICGRAAVMNSAEMRDLDTGHSLPEA